MGPPSRRTCNRFLVGIRCSWTGGAGGGASAGANPLGGAGNCTVCAELNDRQNAKKTRLKNPSFHKRRTRNVWCGRSLTVCGIYPTPLSCAERILSQGGTVQAATSREQVRRRFVWVAWKVTGSGESGFPIPSSLVSRRIDNRFWFGSKTASVAA